MTTVKRVKVTPIESISSKLEPVSKEKFPDKPQDPVRWLINRFKLFCSVTALHGFGHIVRDDNSLAEKIFWTICTLTSHATAFVLLWFSWNWSTLTPVVTVIESTHYATWNIPFPAVTICNLNKINAKKALARATAMRRPDNVSAEALADMFHQLTIFMGYTHESSDDFSLIDETLEMNNVTVFQLLQELAPTCPETMDRCMWKGTQTRCDTLFQPINSTLGLCCSFNYYAAEKMNYPAKLLHSIPKQPRRVTACGHQTGLTVIIAANLENYHTTILGSSGFRIMIHNSYDLVDDNAETKIIAPRLEAFLSVAPEATYATKDVIGLPVSVRKCFNPTEVRMSTVVKYSYLNCMAECRSEIAEKLCGCVPPNMPNNGSRRFCQMRDLACIVKHKNIYSGAAPGFNITLREPGKDEWMEETLTVCPCLPDCEYVKYGTEITTGAFSRNNSFNAVSFFKDINLDDKALVHVFFQDLVSTRYRMDMNQNWLSWLATIGGILGLFLGFSIVTGFEFIYLFSLRVFFDRYAEKHHQKIEPPTK
ncbi:sodium channel protein Nach-like [Phlebotomus argentipes]|uniref:sodium channel protein Nach-like n=1 Tax=Phlebotomus argentipes TaxID=94469 RepID=UPI002892B8C6|nr:sodium channel protein Nach-like [Phlebotomus argentipes]